MDLCSLVGNLLIRWMRMQWLAGASRLLLCSLLGQTTLPSASNAAEKNILSNWASPSSCGTVNRDTNLVYEFELLKGPMLPWPKLTSSYLLFNLWFRQSMGPKIFSKKLKIFKAFYILYNHRVILWTISFNWIERRASDSEVIGSTPISSTKK